MRLRSITLALAATLLLTLAGVTSATAASASAPPPPTKMCLENYGATYPWGWGFGYDLPPATKATLFGRCMKGQVPGLGTAVSHKTGRQCVTRVTGQLAEHRHIVTHAWICHYPQRQEWIVVTVTSI